MTELSEYKPDQTEPAPKPRSRMTVRDCLESEDFKAQLALVMPPGITPDMVARVAITQMARTPRLADCTPASMCSALLDLAAAGLTPDGRRAHLVPYNDQCTLVIDYKGYVELIRRNPDISLVRMEVVCENDDFEHDRGAVIRHTWKDYDDRGEPLAAYAEVVFLDGSRQVCIMGKKEIEGIRDRQKKRSDSPWFSDALEMWKKTALRRLAKSLTLPSAASYLIAQSDDAERRERAAVGREVKAEPADIYSQELPEDEETYNQEVPENE